ncbi:hypothetical protein JCM8547_007451 [Rhodosporidiobolus lusitaniae]
MYGSQITLQNLKEGRTSPYSPEKTFEVTSLIRSVIHIHLCHLAIPGPTNDFVPIPSKLVTLEMIDPIGEVTNVVHGFAQVAGRDAYPAARHSYHKLLLVYEEKGTREEDLPPAEVAKAWELARLRDYTAVPVLESLEEVKKKGGWLKEAAGAFQRIFFAGTDFEKD